MRWNGAEAVRWGRREVVRMGEGEAVGLDGGGGSVVGWGRSSEVEGRQSRGHREGGAMQSERKDRKV